MERIYRANQANLLVGVQVGGRQHGGRCDAVNVPPVSRMHGADTQTPYAVRFSSQEADNSRPVIQHWAAAATEN